MLYCNIPWTKTHTKSGLHKMPGTYIKNPMPRKSSTRRSSRRRSSASARALCEDLAYRPKSRASAKLRAMGRPALASGFERFQPFRLHEMKEYKKKYGRNPGGHALKLALKRASVKYHKCYTKHGTRKSH
jgi:hypothetical protein